MLTPANFKRFFRHLFSTPWHVRRHLPAQTLQAITSAIHDSEASHQGQIRFVVEGELHPLHILRGVNPRQRALKLFSDYAIWDTAQNNGVLIYLLLADHDVEIIADRGIDAYVGATGWESICKEMEALFRQGKFEDAMLAGITQVGALLTQHFPSTNWKENELPDTPIVL
ncbi:MAG TPA: TPM domain-containing protein [Methyloradius sp.]